MSQKVDEKCIECRRCGCQVKQDEFLYKREACKTKRCDLRKDKTTNKALDLWDVDELDFLVPVETGGIVVEPERSHDGYIVHSLDDLDEEEREYWQAIMGDRDGTRYHPYMH